MLVCLPSCTANDSDIPEALTWFKETFYNCHQRCSVCKGWLATEQTESIWIETLVYEHALQLVRSSIIVDSQLTLTSPEWLLAKS